MGDATDDALRLTFGRWQVTPNAINTIPSCVRFTLDFRHPSTEKLAQLDALMRSLSSEHVTVEPLLNKAPVTFDARINHILQAAGKRWISRIRHCCLVRFTTPCIWPNTVRPVCFLSPAIKALAITRLNIPILAHWRQVPVRWPAR
jgi:hypothetical protein